MENKTELMLKKTSLSLYSLSEKITSEASKIADADLKKFLNEINSELKSIDSKMLKDFNVKFTDKTKSEILKFL